MAFKSKNHLFPKDCVVEILLKLPIKSILRFRCVSKSWYNFLVSSYFINTHMKLNKKTRLLFISNHYGDEYLSFNLEDKSFVSVLESHLQFLKLVGCCKGIICFWSYEDNLVLFNPSTRELKVLPHFMRLLDVHVRLESTGFCFDDLNNDYKIILILWVFDKDICVKQKGYPYTYEVAIYSLRSNTWRKLQNKNINNLLRISDFVNLSCSNLFFNGRVHWDLYYEDDEDHSKIFSMDISSETFYEFQYPGSVGSTLGYYNNLHVIRGSLSVILFHALDLYKYIHIWSMKEYGIIDTWSKQYTIGPVLSIDHVVSIRENENEEEEEDHLNFWIQDVKEEESNNWELVSWNLLKNEKVKKYCLNENFYNIWEVVCYSQSLVSIAENKLDYI